MLQKSAELKRIDAIKDTRVNIVQDSSLEKGLVKSIPNVKFESPLMETEEFIEITETRKFILEINGMKKSLEPGEYILGRGTEVDIQIQDQGISRKHLVIVVDEKVTVKDLNSTNGTYINGERITELEVVDQITFRVGVTEIRIASEIQ
jgi:pSer/pThr/pTyr-binding forkhead associated (FHA) protein